MAKKALNSNVDWSVIFVSRSDDFPCPPGKRIFFLRHGLRFGAFQSGQGKEEGCSLVHRAFRPDAPAVSVNDPLDGGKTDAGPGKFGHGMQALKGAEQLSYISHVEARAVIADEINGFIVFWFRSKFDLRPLPLGGELPGVV